MFRIGNLLLLAAALAACAADPRPLPDAPPGGGVSWRPAPHRKAPPPASVPDDLHAKLKQLNDDVRKTRDKLGEPP